ncbi:MAG: hypothetical protein ABIK37_03400 [candidate division WOR-3 bacterium]
MKLPRLLSVVCCLFSAVTAREFMIDTLGTHTQWNPAVAFDGENFLVVWEDFRAGDYSRVHCSRVSPTGQVLDPVGIPVCRAAIDQRDPAIAFDGTNYLVAWQHWKDGAWSSDIHCVRVSPAREMLDSTSIAVCNASGRQAEPAVSFDGENFLVAWHDDRRAQREYDLYAARVTTAGRVLDSTGFVVSAEPGQQMVPAALFDGGNHLVVWFDGRSGQYDIYGSRVSPDGTVLDPDGIPISTAAYDQWAAATAFDGENYLVIWADERLNRVDIYGARVSPQGTVLDPDGIPVACRNTTRLSPTLAFRGSDYLGVWSSRNQEETDLYGAKVSPDGAVGEEVPVAVAPYTQQHPAVAYGGGEVFVVYKSYTYIVDGKYYGHDRVWGKFGPFPGVEEARNAEFGARNPGATIVRGVLRVDLPPAADRPRQELLDATGRRVIELQPGANDVRHLSPGVYFVCSPERREPKRIVLVE